MRKALIAIILILAVVLLGCAKKTETPTQTPTTPTTTSTQTPSVQEGTTIEEEKELANLTKEISELEQMLNELQELENVSFEV